MRIPEGFCVHMDQLLPNVAERQEIEGESNSLVNEHESNRSLQVGIPGHDTIHVSCMEK